MRPAQLIDAVDGVSFIYSTATARSRATIFTIDRNQAFPTAAKYIGQTVFQSIPGPVKQIFPPESPLKIRLDVFDYVIRNDGEGCTCNAEGNRQSKLFVLMMYEYIEKLHLLLTASHS